jgi:hypothetical protein
LGERGCRALDLVRWLWLCFQAGQHQGMYKSFIKAQTGSCSTASIEADTAAAAVVRLALRVCVSVCYAAQVQRDGH